MNKFFDRANCLSFPLVNVSCSFRPVLEKTTTLLIQAVKVALGTYGRFQTQMSSQFHIARVMVKIRRLGSPLVNVLLSLISRIDGNLMAPIDLIAIIVYAQPPYDKQLPVHVCEGRRSSFKS